MGEKLPDNCPQCRAEKDYWYGWWPLIREWPVRLGICREVIVKAQCFACGYHRAYWAQWSDLGEEYACS
jgi:hypothetical protein